MNVKAVLTASVLAAALAPASTLATCHKPTPPALPNPDSAVVAQMMKAKHQMRAFMAAANTYLDCVAHDNTQYNAWVDEMTRAADAFNTIVRRYKKRMATT